jgi:hypothetical protein
MPLERPCLVVYFAGRRYRIPSEKDDVFCGQNKNSLSFTLCQVPSANFSSRQEELI